MTRFRLKCWNERAITDCFRNVFSELARSPEAVNSLWITGMNGPRTTHDPGVTFWRKNISFKDNLFPCKSSCLLAQISLRTFRWVKSNLPLGYKKKSQTAWITQPVQNRWSRFFCVVFSLCKIRDRGCCWVFFGFFLQVLQIYTCVAFGGIHPAVANFSWPEFWRRLRIKVPTLIKASCSILWTLTVVRI